MPPHRQLDIDPLERVHRYQRFYGGLIFDKLWSVGVRDTMLSPQLRPLRQDMVLAGRVLTVKMHNHAENEDVIRERGDRPWGGGPRQRLVMEAITPGCVICVDTGPSFLSAHWGEMSCHLAQSLGATGLLMAGNVRDTRIILRMHDFPVFTMGVVANAKTGWIVEQVEVPIYLPGHLRHSVLVNPGDFVFGDTDGVQVIPGALADEVMLRCEALLDDEDEERKRIRGGMSIDDIFGIYGGL